MGPQSTYTFIQLGQLGLLAFIAPIAGSLSDMYGSRYLMLLGCFGGLLGSGLAAGARNMNTIIVGGIILGVAAGLQVQVYATNSELVPYSWRPIVNGLFQLALIPAIGFAPVISHSLYRHSSWRWCFWIPFIVFWISTFSLLLFYNPIPKRPFRQLGIVRSVFKFDILGALVFFAGIVLFALGVSMGGQQFAWNSAVTLCLVLIGFGLLVLVGLWTFIFSHRFKFPMFLSSVFGKWRGFTTINLAIFFQSMSDVATNNYWPTATKGLFTSGEVDSGWYDSAYTLPMAIFPIFAALIFYFFRWRNHQFTFYIMMIWICNSCNAIISPTSSTKSSVLVAMVGGFASASFWTAMLLTQYHVGTNHIGFATGFLFTSKNIGGAIGSTLYHYFLTKRVTDSVSSTILVPLTRAGVDFFTIQPTILALIAGNMEDPNVQALTPQQRQVGVAAVAQAYAPAFRFIYKISIAFGGVGLLFSLMSLDYHPLTNRVDALPASGGWRRSIDFSWKRIKEREWAAEESERPRDDSYPV